jgi:hypothetical protein
MGLEEWRDAFLVDLARGSTLVQLWGDVAQLGDDDVAFLADALRLARRRDVLMAETVRVGGDPWLAEPYGYIQPTDAGALVTLVNPGFEWRGLPAFSVQDGLEARELYPYPGAEPGPLAPWEVRVIELVPAAETDSRAHAERPSRRDSVRLDLSQVRGSGAVTLPELGRHDVVAIAVRLRRDGVAWYHPEPHSLVRLRALLGGAQAAYTTAPATRSRNGPGCPWVIFKLPAGAWWSGKELSLELESDLPAGIELDLEGWIYKAWWDESPRRFAPLEPVAAARL